LYGRSLQQFSRGKTVAKIGKGKHCAFLLLNLIYKPLAIKIFYSSCNQTRAC
jgi:hypothetical protein